MTKDEVFEMLCPKIDNISKHIYIMAISLFIVRLLMRFWVTGGSLCGVGRCFTGGIIICRRKHSIVTPTTGT